MKPEQAFHRSGSLRHTRAYFSSPDAAAERNFTTEMLQTLAGYQRTAPGYLSLEQQYQPQYQALNLDQQRRGMLGFDDPTTGAHTPGSLELQRTGTNYQRAGDISDVAALGPASTAAFLAANPLLAGSLNNLFSRTSNTGLLNTLNDQAASGLAAGGNLTAEEQRAVDQQTRAGFSGRGTLQGNQAIASEILNRDAARRARLQSAQQLATGVQSMNQGQNDFVGRASQIFGTTLSDPFQAILGRSSGSGGGSGGYPQQIGTGAHLFDPTNPYAGDVYNSNFNAENAHNIADANASNANTGAAIQGAASIASLLGVLMASDERLKKKIKTVGETDDGIPVKEFEYKTDPKKRRFRGVMAQDVEKVKPQNVRTDPVSGLKMVDYWNLGTPMVEVAA